MSTLVNIEMFAMAFITTCAGAELIIHELRPVLSSILAQVTCMYTNTYTAVYTNTYIIHTHVSVYNIVHTHMSVNNVYR